MRSIYVWTLAVSLAFLACLSPSEAQLGGMGGGGMGAFGGGFSVPQQGNSRDPDTFTYPQLLSPGATDPWPVKAQAGEVLIVSVTSQAFDPKVRLVAPGGKVLAENDDIRPGVQDARLLYTIPADGTYTVQVVGARETAGGRYELKVRRFLAREAPFDSRASNELGKDLRQWHRFRLTSGQVAMVTARLPRGLAVLEVIGPRGQTARAPVPALVILRDSPPGPYFVRVSGRQPQERYQLTVALARVVRTTTGAAPVPRRLAPDGLDLWRFPGKKGDVVRIAARSAEGRVGATLRFVPPPGEAPPAGVGVEVAPVGGKAPGEELPEEAELKDRDKLVILPSDPKRPSEIVALLRRDGEFEATVLEEKGLGPEYTLAVTPAARPLDGAAAEDRLTLGDSHYWSLPARPGAAVRVEGKSEQFDAELELYGPSGELVTANDDSGSSRDAFLSARAVEPGRYLLRVHAQGDGGSGSYRLGRIDRPEKALAAGARLESTLSEGDTEIWTFDGRAGQAVLLSARSLRVDLHLQLFGPAGETVGTDDDTGLDTDSLLAARLPAAGRYTVWVTAKSGSGTYGLRLIDDP